MSRKRYGLARVFASQEWRGLRAESAVTELSDGWVLLTLPETGQWPIGRTPLISMPDDCEGLIIIAHHHTVINDYDERTDAMRIPGWDGYCQCECVIPSEVLVMAQLEAFTTGYLVWTKPTHDPDVPF